VGRLQPRRGRCVVCLVTHVLLPTSCLLRRADGAEVIGAGLTLKATGRGHRPVAAALGVPAATVRRWFAAFAAAAAAVTSVLAVVAAELDPLRGPLPVHAGGVVAGAVELVGSVAAAARRRLGGGRGVGVGAGRGGHGGTAAGAPAADLDPRVDQHELGLGGLLTDRRG